MIIKYYQEITKDILELSVMCMYNKIKEVV